jgi:hypothetical protein
MIGRIAVVIGAVALVALPTEALAADRCHLPRGARVLARSRIAVVYRIPTWANEVNTSLEYWACVHSTGRKVVLNAYGARGGDTGADFAYSRLFTFTGWLVAFASEDQDHYGGSGATIEVFDLRARAQRYYVAAGGQTPGGSGGPYLPFTILRLALAPTGMTAWVARRMDVPEIATASAEGAGPALLDRGGGIDPSSLTLLGDAVSWTKDGVPQSATPFAPPPR